MHQLHREEDEAVIFPDVEHATDRGMGDLTREADFVHQLRVGRRPGRGDQLERNRRLEHQVVGAPDVAHAAASEARDHPVPPREHVTGLEGVGVLGGRRARTARCVSPTGLFVELEQRFDLAVQGDVGTAGVRDETPALVRRTFECREEQVLGTFVEGHHRVDRSV